jgi:hypothetical protein
MSGGLASKRLSHEKVRGESRQETVRMILGERWLSILTSEDLLYLLGKRNECQELCRQRQDRSDR